MNYSITSKGQVTIPKELRDKIGLRTGGKARIVLLDSRTIAIRTPLSIESIRKNIGKPSNKQPLSAKERQKIASRGL